MRRIKRGWALTKKSWALLNAHRELIRFPLYGGVATILLGDRLPRPRPLPARPGQLRRRAIPLLVIGIYVLTVIGVYFSVGLAAAANLIFSGKDATVADGLAVARSASPQICGWAALSTAISVLMGAAREPGRGRSARSPPAWSAWPGRWSPSWRCR